MSYKVKLELFEGPLDLLLYLIKKEEIDIQDIPIAKITQQYLEALDVIKLLDLDIAGEFLVMAATLMQIKSRMLLPPEEQPPPEEEEPDPRAELVQRLLEYQKFKEAAARLSQMEEERKNLFTRPAVLPREVEEGKEASYFEASIFDLITAFSKITERLSKEQFYEVVKDEYTVEDKIHQILHALAQRSVLHFSELFKEMQNRLEVIATFLAVLELIRLKEILVQQREPFGEIEVSKNRRTIQPRGVAPSS